MFHNPLRHTCHILAPHGETIQFDVIRRELHSAWLKILRSEHWHRARELLWQLRRPPFSDHAGSVCYDDVVSWSGARHHVDLEAREALISELVHLLLPWRTGPFSLSDYHIDSEWQSFMKWNRIASLLPAEAGLRIADVGCGNGYFMYRLLSLRPELVIGFDPIERCWLQFCLLQEHFKTPRLALMPTGLDSLSAFPRFFNLILCMGVIYHQRDPLHAFSKLFQALQPGGVLLLESLCVPHAGEYLLVPRSRYAKMRNAWFIPSPAALGALAERAGFQDIEVHTFEPLSTLEQRRTNLAPYESLADFLSPDDVTKTVEGYPAPCTAAVVARRK